MRYSYHNRSRQPVRSSRMRAEEIERERRMSGWNPYEGEEEPWEGEGTQMPEEFGPGPVISVQPAPDRPMQPGQSMMPGQPMMPMQPGQPMQPGRPMQPGQSMMPGQPMQPGQSMIPGQPMQSGQPIFLQPDPAQDMKEQMEIEREWRSLQAMFPETAKMLLPMIEEECDKMEYEGSPMFDAYPDQTTIWQIQARIEKQAMENLPPEEQPVMQEEEAEVFSMQYQDRRRRRPGENWLGDLARVMLLQEMHHRRCRHNRCRRHRF